MAQEQAPSNLLDGLYSQYPKDKFNILFPTENSHADFSASATQL